MTEDQITFLCEAIEKPTKKITVHVPSQDYYRRRGDFDEEEIRYVDPDMLIQALTAVE